MKGSESCDFGFCFLMAFSTININLGIYLHFSYIHFRVEYFTHRNPCSRIISVDSDNRQISAFFMFSMSSFQCGLPLSCWDFFPPVSVIPNVFCISSVLYRFRWNRAQLLFCLISSRNVCHVNARIQNPNFNIIRALEFLKRVNVRNETQNMYIYSCACFVYFSLFYSCFKLLYFLNSRQHPKHTIMLFSEFTIFDLPCTFIPKKNQLDAYRIWISGWYFCLVVVVVFVIKNKKS